MGEVAQANQYQLQGSLNNAFMNFYLAIQQSYRKHGFSAQFTQALKQFSEYFYRQAIKVKQYRELRTNLINNTLASQQPQRCELFSDGKMTGFLYALPVKSSISTELFDGNVNILTVDHGALQITQKAPIKYKLHHQRLTSGQSSICLSTEKKETHFQAKTNIAVFLSISCNDMIYNK
jgi:hypothetical protein